MKYADLAPYAYTVNNPIKFIDPDGKVVVDANGNTVFAPIGQMSVQHPSGSTATMSVGYIFTNGGTSIVAMKNDHGGASGWNTDCHGQTFTKGQLWVNNNQVPALLAGDNYKNSFESPAQVGDKVIYANSEGVQDSRTISQVCEGQEPVVFGQGGLEVDNSEKSLSDAWNLPGTEAYFARATEDNVQLSNEAIQFLIQDTQNWASEEQFNNFNNRSSQMPDNFKDCTMPITPQK